MSTTTDFKRRQVTGRGIPVPGNDIDTDRIIPARFLKAVTFEGMGEHAFEDARKQNEVAIGMEEMSRKFHDLGGEILVPVAPAE